MKIQVMGPTSRGTYYVRESDSGKQLTTETTNRYEAHEQAKKLAETAKHRKTSKWLEDLLSRAGGDFVKHDPVFPGLPFAAHRFFFRIAQKNEYGAPVGYWRWGRFPSRVMRWWPVIVRHFMRDARNQHDSNADLGVAGLIREGEGVL